MPERDPETGRFLPEDPETRFWKHVEKTNGCWYWTAGSQTYGVFALSHKKSVKAHVFSWELVNGPKPIGLELDHKCLNKLCVRPRHLELVTHATNAKRRTRKRKYRCPKGHLKTKENTYVTPAGVHQCRTCKNEAWRVMYARRKLK